MGVENPFSSLVSQLHDIAKERRLMAEHYEHSAPEMARMLRAQASCYDDAAALAWALKRAHESTVTP